MTTMTRCTMVLGAALLVAPLCASAQVPAPAAAPAAAAAPAQQDNVSPMAEMLRQSAARLRTYEWTETKVMSYKGEERSRAQNRCRYLSDGTVARVAIGTPQQADAPGGVRGRVARNRQEDIAAYMERATTLLRRYVPPDGARLQQLRDSGRVSVTPVQPGRLARLEFRGYLMAGDTVIIDLDLTNSRPASVRVSSYLDSPQERVGLTIRMDALQDGTIYAGETTLDAPAKEVRVTIQNSEYRPAT